LQCIAKWNGSIELRSLACGRVDFSLQFLICIISFTSSSFRLELRVKCSDGQVLFQWYTIAAFFWERVMRWGYLQVVGMLLAEHVLEESINVHSAHPSL
jgi:hypothetical protein